MCVLYKYKHMCNFSAYEQWVHYERQLWNPMNSGWNDLQRIHFLSPLESFALLQMKALQFTGCSLTDWDIFGNETRPIPSPPRAASYITLGAIVPAWLADFKSPQWGDLLWTIKHLQLARELVQTSYNRHYICMVWFNHELDSKKHFGLSGEL